MKRIRITIQGAVQGVGFRPFVYRLARELALTGSVANTVEGVITEVQGSGEAVADFTKRVVADAPPVARITSVTIEELAVEPDETGFVIRSSEDSRQKTVTVLPDLATCPDCRAEILDQRDRRYGYAFTNCTNCGPRFSIINDIPYDRPNTEMRTFTMCPDCQREYHQPADRRFHAQPNACPICGPQLSLEDGSPIAGGKEISRAAVLLREGRILALKGLGGYQLLCDARNEAAVIRLRERKRREEKPLALMFPDLDMIHRFCLVNVEEERLLQSFAAPIVLLSRREDAGLAPSIAPGNPNLGVMLPYTPLHHLLMVGLDFPVVCTSGNLHDEPIAIINEEAQAKLGSIADAFLSHNRPIARHMDDSVVRRTRQGTQYFRRARGYAPLPLRHQREMPNILAVGAHYKNTIAISFGNQTILSQHIGDLSTPEAHRAFARVVEDLPRLYDFNPELVACDLHPDFLSTQYAEGLGLPLVRVQHHHAHVAAVMAEHGLDGPVLGLAWDGTGLGTDDTVWGGECLLCERGSFERIAWLDTFPLGGGDVAIQEPRRSALGLLHRADLEADFPHGFAEHELALVRQALEKGINAPLTSSVGRLFDGVAALLGLRQVTTFEGQSAMTLEFAAAGRLGEAYPFEVDNTINWRPMLGAILKDRDRGVAVSDIAAHFHSTLVEVMVAVARRADVKQVALSGGCFQNRLLYEGGAARLEEAGFTVLLPRELPPNDGAIAAGQAWVTAYN
ncbi:MAG: carbamoyltransferase HypF [Fidelibacterota bacterium]|nr:MAG: carbamoyltransferase HypF [Candidatus Neomarinimicrobiota bacterium]